jgi:hypothetical protein
MGRSENRRNIRRIPMEERGEARRENHTEEVTATIRKLTLQQREQFFKEGKCYYCQKQGHVVAKCPTAPRRPQEGNQPYIIPKYQSKKDFKWNAKVATAYIRKMGSQLQEEDLEDFGKIVEESFQMEDLELASNLCRIAIRSISIISKDNSFFLPIQFRLPGKIVRTKALIDCGA